MSACHRWNEKEPADKTWTNSKVHFAVAHRQYKQVQGESAANYGYQADNADVGQTEDKMVEANIGELVNLETATSTARGIVATLIEANLRLARQLEERSNEVKEVKALLKKECDGRRGQITFTPSPDNYCWSHGYKVAKNHISQSCSYPKGVHKRDATKANNMGACQANNE
jgi:hypothetical protein